MSKSIGSVALERRVDALFSPCTRPGSPGAVVAVMRGGEIELCKGYGLASIELGVPIRPGTRFRIASVSKQFTVSAALMLAEEGKLKLSDPPHKYLSELKPLPVTIDQMMRNASGLPDFLELLRLGGHGLDKPARPQDVLAACLRNTHLNFAPGSRFLYSNTNFLLLGLIIEKVSGQKLGDFLAERIFKPLGMTSTQLVHAIDTVIPGLATGYLGDFEGGFRRAAHAYPQGGEGGLTSTVEDLLIWSRHFDQPMLSPKNLPAQLAAAAPLTGGHANKYRRGVQADEMRGLATIGHGGLWPGYRTEFLRVPQADLTVVVIANLGSLDPWRQSRAIATLALEGDKRLKPALPAITQAEIKPLSGTWFNADEPALFGLAWRNGEATVAQNGMPFVLGRRADGALAAERGSFEFAVKPRRAGTAKGAARVDLGAGRVVVFKKLGRRKAVPTALAGTYVSADSGAIWKIERSGEDWMAHVGGPLIAGGEPWPVRGIDTDTVEVESPGSWLQVTQLAHLVRDRVGRVVALEVSTGRIKKMRFERVA
jgi:CubicO group peptidase (beta-lactamase class C family)